VSGPLTDNINASLTLMDAEFDGYIDNVYTNEKVNGYDKKGVRAMFDITLSDDTSALIIYEDYNANNDCCVDLVGRNTNASRPLDPSVFVAGSGLNLDQRRVDNDFETRTKDSTTAFSIQLVKDIGDYTLTSITAKRTWKNTEYREGDFTSQNGDMALPVDFSTVGFQLHDVGPQEWRQFSQEVRLASPGGETFDWQIGGFYWDIDSSRNFTRDASCQVTGDNTAIVDAANLADPTLGLTCLQNDIVSATAYMSTEFTNYAVFGDGSFDLTDALSILFGLRYTDDEVSFKHNRRNNDEFGRRGVGVRQETLNTDFGDSVSEDNISGKLGLQFNVNDQNMVYATYSTGYKGPAFNVFYNMSENDVNPIDPEESESIEFGYKFTGDQLFLSAAYYKTEIDDSQANDFDVSDGTTTTGFTNGGDVETEGVEVDFMWQVLESLKLSGGVAVSDAETTVGDALPFAPDLKYSISSAYSIPLNDGAEWVINASYVYTDEQLSGNIGQDEDSNPEVLLPDYEIINASITYRAPEDKYSVALVGKNLTDESYATTYSGDGFRYQIPRDAERYFGVNFRFNF
jgi:iron complex outermembrane receptor protein